LAYRFLGVHLGHQAALTVGTHRVLTVGMLIAMLDRAADGFGAAAPPHFGECGYLFVGLGIEPKRERNFVGVHRVGFSLLVVMLNDIQSVLTNGLCVLYHTMY
jgi:hypothetical protein